LVTSIAAFVAIAVTGAGVSAAVALPSVFLVQVWIPDPRIFFGLNAVSWFVACEAFFYLLFPLLHRGLVRLAGRALWPGTIAVFATVWAIPLVAQLVPESARYWAIWILPVARLPEFLAGMLLARIVAEGKWPVLGVWHWRSWPCLPTSRHSGCHGIGDSSPAPRCRSPSSLAQSARRSCREADPVAMAVAGADG
jgi:peptidoglycan/LPS O-acetylase OafA/YrhL